MKLRTSTFLAAFFALSLSIPCVSTLPSNGNTIRVPQDYPKIQQAIDKANPSDVIQVASGEYQEKLKITKPIHLIGEGPSKTIIIGTETVIFVNASEVEIRGFSVRDGTYGIFLWYCHNILLRNNEISNNRWNFGVWGEHISHFVHDIDSSNTVDGKPVYYWVDRNGGQVPNDAGYVALVNSSNVLVRDASLTSNEQGVLLVTTANSVIENITVIGNDEGIDLRMSHNNTIRKSRFVSTVLRAVYLEDSHNNTLYENTMLNNILGLSLKGCNRNAFYHNNFIENKDQVWQALTEQTSWQNEDVRAGNYWSDYTGQDANGDGVGDTPYIIDNSNQDNYPMINIYDLESPRTRAGEDKTVAKNSAAIFDASESFDDVGIHQYLWDFGDGTTEVGRIVSHAYADVGNYTVTLTVVDLVGKAGMDILNVVVVEAPQVPWWWVIASVLAAGVVLLLSVFLWRSRFGIKKK